MPRKPTFIPRTSKGDPCSEAISYTPILFQCGDTLHRLALHRDIHGIAPIRQRPWIVSHPEIGGKICIVYSEFRGTSVQSNYLTSEEAFQAAITTLNNLRDRIGSDKLNEVIQKGLEKVKAPEKV